MHRRAAAAIPFLPLMLCLAAPGARADCALGATYAISTTGPNLPNTVTVCAQTTRCGAAGQTMLRQDVATGEIVQLADFCSSSACYVDECVPEGSYRYGYATPFTCDQKGCGDSVPYFVTATVSTAPASSCARSATDTGPVAYTGTAPWGAGGTQEISCGSSGCVTPGFKLGTNVAALDAGALVAAALLWLRIRKRAR